MNSTTRAHELFEEAIEWLQENYDEFGFDMERNVVLDDQVLPRQSD